MRHKQTLVSLCVITWSLTSGALYAWNDLGHLTVARVAYLRLSDTERAGVVALLRHHPHLQELLLKDCPSNVHPGEYLFANAATWPDRVRPPRIALHEPVKSHPVYRFHHPTWHYANWEFQVGRSPTQAALARRAPVHPVDQGEIVEQLDRSFLILTGAVREQSEPEAELDSMEIRAIRLCWLMHLMGDIHQPLHVINYVDPQIPSLESGDDGGNKLAIRVNHSSGPQKVHAFWDDLLGTHPQFNKVVQFGEMLTHDPRFSATHLPEFAQHKQTREIAEESYQIAREVIYQNGRLHFALWSRVESHELASADVPVLPQQVVDQAHAIAQRQILLAGYRLAERLKLVVAHDSQMREPNDLADPVPRDRRPSRFVRQGAREE